MRTNANEYNDRNGGRLVIEGRRNRAEWVRTMELDMVGYADLFQRCRARRSERHP